MQKSLEPLQHDEKDKDAAILVQAFFSNLDHLGGANGFLLAERNYRFINYLQSLVSYFANKLGNQVPDNISKLLSLINAEKREITNLVGDSALQSETDSKRALTIPKELNKHVKALEAEIKNAGIFTNITLKKEKLSYLQGLIAIVQLKGGYNIDDISKISERICKLTSSDPSDFRKRVREGRTVVAEKVYLGSSAKDLLDFALVHHDDVKASRSPTAKM